MFKEETDHNVGGVNSKTVKKYIAGEGEGERERFVKNTRESRQVYRS